MNNNCPRCGSGDISVLMAGYMGVQDYDSKNVFQAGDRVICKRCHWLGTVYALNSVNAQLRQVQSILPNSIKMKIVKELHLIAFQSNLSDKISYKTHLIQMRWPRDFICEISPFNEA